MLNHHCDVYHLRKTDASPGYQLPSSPSFSYPDEPDISGVRCHFGVKNGTRSIVQLEPQAIYEARIKLAYPIGIDIRLNDKIVSLEDGYEYTADNPIKVRSHHMFVWLRRTKGQEPINGG